MDLLTDINTPYPWEVQAQGVTTARDSRLSVVRRSKGQGQSLTHTGPVSPLLTVLSRAGGPGIREARVHAVRGRVLQGAQPWGRKVSWG